MRSITLEAAVTGIFAGGHFVYDSIRKNAGNTLVGFLGVLGVSCFWSIKELKEQEKEWQKDGSRSGRWISNELLGN